MTCKPGCVRLQNAVLAHWSSQSYNAGCYNEDSKLDDKVTPSAHARGEAFDIGIDPAYRGRQSVGQQIFFWLYANRRALGIVQLIYSGQIWSESRADDGIRPYTRNPHLDHIHVQLSAGAFNNANLPIPPFPGAAPMPPITAEDDMTPDQARMLTEVHAAIFNGDKPGGVLRDISAMLGRGWNFHPADPDSAAFLKIKDLHVIAGSLRDGLGGMNALKTMRDNLTKVVAAAVKTIG